jgi:hypothetical protein
MSIRGLKVLSAIASLPAVFMAAPSRQGCSA